MTIGRIYALAGGKKKFRFCFSLQPWPFRSAPVSSRFTPQINNLSLIHRGLACFR